MDKEIMMLINQLMLSSEQMQQYAEAGEWDDFLDESVAYSMGMKALCDIDFTLMSERHMLQATDRMAKLLEHDVQLTSTIKARLAAVRGELSSMRKSSASAKAYLSV